MRRWYVPLTVLGLGSVGAFLLSPRGRSILQAWQGKLLDVPNQLRDLSNDVSSELECIQGALDRIAAQVEAGPELSR